MKNKKYLAIIFFLLVVIVILLFNRKEQNTSNSLLGEDENAVEWDGKQHILTKNENKGIAIPGFDRLVLSADSLEQKVNLYNPDVNDCMFLMTLFVDDKELWKSEYLSPGYGFYDITMSETLNAGNYDGYLRIQCFKSDGIELNSAVVNFNVEVQ